MTVWYHHPTIFNRLRTLRSVGLLSLIVAVITTVFLAFPTSALSTTKTVSFQGRILSISGAVVPDGTYNVQFKIYEGGTGTSAGNPNGTLKWTETYINNGGTSGVQIRNGFLSVELGSQSPFNDSVDWNAPTLWLSMNIAGSATNCTTFGSGACTADGEMLPMKKMTASPYAINSGALEGKTASQFAQLGQGVQVDATNNASIFVNKTGSGNLVQLQSTGNTVFTVTGTGNLTLGADNDKTISVDTASSGSDGKRITVVAGTGGSGSGSTGGDIVVRGGNAGGTNGDGGDVLIDAGDSTGSGNDGTISIGTLSARTIAIGANDSASTQTITIGSNNTSGSATDIVIGAGGSATSGTTTIQAKNAITVNTNGVTRATFSDMTNTVYFGNGAASTSPSDFVIQGTNSSLTAVSGGDLTVKGGNATTGNADGGSITISGGTASGSGSDGLVIISTPTFSTVINDSNCYTSGALVASSCTVASTSVNSSAAVLVGFSTTGQTATLPDPTNLTAGRVMYIMAAGTSETFTLSLNGGGAGNTIAMRANLTASLVWNGSDWTVASASTQSPVTYSSDGSQVQIGDGVASGDPTLLTLDRASAAPTGDESLLGSMYYDTTIGALQCYEEGGWGSCSTSPDTFVTLSPEFSNAVQNGTGIGTMTTDICSDSLNVNDGSASQPTVCGSNETYNYYNWTSAETSAQSKSIFVTYQLPDNFKQFVNGSTSLKGRTDSADASVSYQIYRNNSGGLTACGSSVSVSTGSQTSWQTGAASTDPSTCSFVAGESIVFKITLSAFDDANAYVSNLRFAYSNQ